MKRKLKANKISAGNTQLNEREDEVAEILGIEDQSCGISVATYGVFKNTNEIKKEIEENEMETEEKSETELRPEKAIKTEKRRKSNETTKMNLLEKLVKNQETFDNQNIDYRKKIYYEIRDIRNIFEKDLENKAEYRRQKLKLLEEKNDLKKKILEIQLRKLGIDLEKINE